MNEFLYLLRRELWEHRALVIVPAVFLAIIVVAVTLGIMRGTEYVGLSHIVYELRGLPDEQAREGFGVGAFAIWSVFWMTTYFVVAFYLLDALYADRKDRSVLFWKSLPISDSRTVLSKLATAIVVAPVIAIVAALATILLLMLVASAAILIGGGNPLTLLWLQFPWLAVPWKMAIISLVHSLWFLPFVGWLLFASSAAKRTPFLMASLVPIGIALAEWVAFDSAVFADAIGRYASQFYETMFGTTGEFGIHVHKDEINVAGSLGDLGSVLDTLTDPLLPVGLAIGAAFVWGAIEMRRRRVDAG